MRYLTAGESHGKALVAIIEGLPAGLNLSENVIDDCLARRMRGYGRGERMNIECDKAQILAGVRGGKTLGSPLAFVIPNLDYENRKGEMAAFEIPSGEKITRPRAGHADLSGCIKYGFDDVRNVSERASARESAARVGVGAVAKELLHVLGIEIASRVTAIGSVSAPPLKEQMSAGEIAKAVLNSPLSCLDAESEKRMIRLIDEAKKKGDTLGGKAEIVISGAPCGIGSYVHADRRLSSTLAAAAMSVQSAKAVRIGDGGISALFGSAAADAFEETEDGFKRKTNHSGGIDGGMSSGEDIRITVEFKPLPSVKSGVPSFDMKTRKSALSAPIRSDVCAVPAAAVTAECVMAFALCDELLKVTGGDHIDEVRQRVQALREKQKRAFEK